MDPDELTETCGVDPSWICQQVFDWSGGNDDLARTAEFLLAKPLTILLIFVVAVIVNRLIRRAIRNLVNRIATGSQRDGLFRSVMEKAPDVLATPRAKEIRSAARAQTIGQVLRSVSSVLVYSIAALMILGELGVDVAPLVASAGIVGIALGFGAQSLVKDVISGIFMLLEDQFGVGDVVDVGEASGEIEAVTLRVTRLRDGDGTVWYVPNGQVLRVGNKSQQWARAVVDAVVAYGTDVHAATEVIRRAANELRQEPEWAERIQEDPEVLGIEALGADGIRIRVSMQTEPGEQWAVMRELRLRLTDALAAAGIKLPPPPGTLVMPEAVPSERPGGAGASTPQGEPE